MKMSFCILKIVKPMRVRGEMHSECSPWIEKARRMAMRHSARNSVEKFCSRSNEGIRLCSTAQL